MAHRWTGILFSLTLILALSCAAVAEDMVAFVGDAKSTGPQPAAAPCPNCQPSCEGCCDNCCYCDPVWTVQADALFLNRSGLPSRNLLIVGAVPSLLNANDFNLPVQLGWQIDVARQLNCDWGLDARYFNLGGQSASINRPIFDDDEFLDGQPISTNLAFYTSRLQSVELNARRNLNDCVTLLAGVRYINLDDQILVNEFRPSLVLDGNFQLGGFNDMLGFQIGADAIVLQRCGFSVDLLLKAGIYDDRAEMLTPTILSRLLINMWTTPRPTTWPFAAKSESR